MKKQFTDALCLDCEVSLCARCDPRYPNLWFVETEGGRVIEKMAFESTVHTVLDPSIRFSPDQPLSAINLSSLRVKRSA